MNVCQRKLLLGPLTDGYQQIYHLLNPLCAAFGMVWNL